ncbi:hypothetical protein [Bradyrhizobium japonicum]|uniref:hypothetical protein n=1 Tax=Bradyrhizobium japonicum TaxID=375 RepID=UPI0027150A4E|nr:hypothetical protein [Bradyrhizobium japonicum]WLB57902.1 hypothetical protein QIH94_18495 [Bradyrhizobium japonicum]WLB60232.1 hypothetical protein QIH96_27450 [Bradyrhizobium japonicum]
MWPRKRHAFGVIALLCVAFVIFISAGAPSSQEAMRRSLAELRLPELTTAFALHPDTCSIERSFWKWHVRCEGVPISFYQDRMRCDPGPPRTCSVVEPENQICVSYYWDIDLNGMPSNSLGDHGRHASVGDGCSPKGSRLAEREAMAKRGISPNRVE